MSPSQEISAILSARGLSNSPLGLEDLSQDFLRKLTHEHGIDVATAFAFDRVRRSSRHVAFIREIDRLREATTSRPFSPDVLVGIVPAAFYREMPHTGADGRVLRETAAKLGLQTELIPVHSSGTLAENTASIHAWLAENATRRIVLISLCKGGADLKYAWRLNPDAFRQVAAWINVCGTLDGSPFAAWMLASKPRFIATWLYFKCQRRNFAMLRELVPAKAGPLSHALTLPPALPFISIIGFPLQRHLSNGFMRRCHRFIASSGPNDGGVLLSSVLPLPGALYPVWGADHYLRPEARAVSILTGALRYLADKPSVSSLEFVSKPIGNH